MLMSPGVCVRSQLEYCLAMELKALSLSLSLSLSRCEGCKAVSAVDSQFYELELNIKGHKMLSECLAEFFQVLASCCIP